MKKYLSLSLGLIVSSSIGAMETGEIGESFCNEENLDVAPILKERIIDKKTGSVSPKIIRLLGLTGVKPDDYSLESVVKATQNKETGWFKRKWKFEKDFHSSYFGLIAETLSNLYCRNIMPKEMPNTVVCRKGGLGSTAQTVEVFLDLKENNPGMKLVCLLKGEYWKDNTLDIYEVYAKRYGKEIPQDMKIPESQEELFEFMKDIHSDFTVVEYIDPKNIKESQDAILVAPYNQINWAVASVKEMAPSLRLVGIRTVSDEDYSWVLKNLYNQSNSPEQEVQAQLHLLACELYSTLQYLQKKNKNDIK